VSMCWCVGVSMVVRMPWCSGTVCDVECLCEGAKQLTAPLSLAQVWAGCQPGSCSHCPNPARA
jgi:hypothetical protein